ncbi:IS1-like element transposase [Candidatus Enterovibrio escicola]|uniref:Insertion element IS1 protein InsA helix-turn-helix domain-containing protein n=1 Tax=Candidatus Enterovibrio escicola TaxID=1927127 RepID=A0A2A5T2Y7_9GAMM|nr:IS1-like element transposase [Candidatus Enterovibrio escacola]PCS22533.1 hypothetical protein BTN49_1754 [Candidatus Enterovibrio escacola]
MACQAGIKEQIVKLAMSNAGIHDSSGVLLISNNTVVMVLKNLHTLRNYTPS